MNFVVVMSPATGGVSRRLPFIAASRSFSGPARRRISPAPRTAQPPSSSPSVRPPTFSRDQDPPSVASAHANRSRLLRSSSPRSSSSAATGTHGIKLFQYRICPFCNITKSLLSYSRVGYESVEVNPLTKAELKPWSGDYRKVPIALTDEGQLNGSDVIIDAVLSSPGAREALETRWADDVSGGERKEMMTMQQFKESDSAKTWTAFARDDLAALLYPNICGSLGDSYDAFGYVNDVRSFTPFQKMSVRTLGALAMYLAASKVKSKRNIVDARAALDEALDKFESEGLRGGDMPYTSGLQSPEMGDVAVFGVLYSVRGLEAHNHAIEMRGGHLKQWYDRMFEQVIGEKMVNE